MSNTNVILDTSYGRSRKSAADAAQTVSAELRSAEVEVRDAEARYSELYNRLLNGDATVTAKDLAEAKDETDRATLLRDVGQDRAQRAARNVEDLDRIELAHAAAHALADVLPTKIHVGYNLPDVAPKSGLPVVYVAVRGTTNLGFGLSAGTLDVVLHARSAFERMPEASVIRAALERAGFELGGYMAEPGADGNSTKLSVRVSSGPEWLPTMVGAGRPQSALPQHSWTNGIRVDTELTVHFGEPVILSDRPAGDGGLMIRKSGVRVSFFKRRAEGGGSYTHGLGGAGQKMDRDERQAMAEAAGSSAHAGRVKLEQAIMNAVDNFDIELGRVTKVKLLDGRPHWGDEGQNAPGFKHEFDAYVEIFSTYRGVVEDEDHNDDVEGDPYGDAEYAAAEPLNA